MSTFAGQRWNSEAQRKFTLLLSQAAFFQGSGSTTLSDFSARDRIGRAPKTFGFLRGDSKQPLELSVAGRQLLAKDDLPDLFLHQLLKWQYPSAIHRDKDYQELFRIKPFLEMLRLIRDVGSLNKAELALFGVPFIDYRNYDALRETVRDFRKRLNEITGRFERRKFVAREFQNHYRLIYADDIEAGRIATREEGGTEGNEDKFIEKKTRNARDYADAAIRYFRLTGLFTVVASPFHYQLRLLPERFPEVEAILDKLSRMPEPYADKEAFFIYMGNPMLPALPGDDTEVLVTRMWTIYNTLVPSLREASDRSAMRLQVEESMASGDVRRMKSAYNALATNLEELTMSNHQGRLSCNLQAINEVLDQFNQIADKTIDVIDRPLFFEWNIWRGLAILNYGKVVPHFKMDTDGIPIGLSPAGMADMRAEYDDFHLIIDVTTAFGATQYNMEGEPVFRHVGSAQREARAAGDQRPIYGLFVAERLTPTIVTDFFARHRIPTTEFAGPVHIVPLAVEDFRRMLEAASVQGRWSSADVYRFFRRSVELALIASDEAVWHKRVQHLAKNWLDASIVDSIMESTDLTMRYAEQKRILQEIENQLWDQSTH